MKKLLNYIVILSMGIILSACYNDKGNYDYKDINDVIIAQPKEISVQIPQTGSVVVTIDPDIKQTQTGSDQNLAFLWQRNDGMAKWIECGTEKICKINVTPADKSNILLRLSVTDTKQNIVSYQEYVIKMIFPFSRNWFVLQNIAGQAVLGSIDGEGENRIFAKNVYFDRTGQQLVGTPKMLMINNNHLQVVNQLPGITSPPETLVGVFSEDNGVMLDGNNLSTRYQYNDLLLLKRIQGDNVFQPVYATADMGENIIDNGVFWYALQDGLSIHYPVKLSADAGSTYKATMSMAVNESINIVFDQQNNRFLSYLNTDIGVRWFQQMSIRGGNTNTYLQEMDGVANSPRLSLIGENAGYRNMFDPSNIGGGKTMRYMGPTTDKDASKSIAIATDGSKCYIYEFSTKGLQGGSAASCSGYYTFTPEGDLQKVSFASSSYFNKMFFYSTGNKIYRVDLNRTIPQHFLVYTHPDANAKITKIKFCSDRRPFGKWLNAVDYQFAYLNSQLGAAVDLGGGKASIVEMKLTTGGEISKDDAGKKQVFEFGGFENIVDIGYSAK